MDLAAVVGDLLAHRLGDGDEVGDRGPRGVQGGQSERMGLDLADPLRADPLEAGHAVAQGRLLEGVERPSSEGSIATTSLPHSL